MSDYLLDGATREIERLNKIARQFDEQVARLTRERDDLREVLTVAEERLYRHGLLQGPDDPVVKALATISDDSE